MFLFFCKLSIAVPLGTAFYPQHGKIDYKDVEESIKKLYVGKTPEYFLYNKGLWLYKCIKNWLLMIGNTSEYI